MAGRAVEGLWTGNVEFGMAATVQGPMLLQPRAPGWIYKPSWDLPLLIFSAGLVPLPFLIAWLAQVSGLAQTAAGHRPDQYLGGAPDRRPASVLHRHLYLPGREFRSRHPWYASLAFALPAAVVYLGIYHYTLLITFFFSWASLHVLHQIIYLTDCYRRAQLVCRAAMVAAGGLRADPDGPVSHRALQNVAAAVPGGRGGAAVPRFRAAVATALGGGDGFRGLPGGLDRQDRGGIPRGTGQRVPRRC